jgi:hypothetical protein
MKKLILLSMIFALIIIPARAARAKNAREGLKRVLVQTALFEVVYLLLLLYVWPRLN